MNPQREMRERRAVQPERSLAPLPRNVEVWTSLEQARQTGVSERELIRMATQVSEAVNAYCDENPSEMLRKTPEGVLQQFLDGNSCLMGTRENGHYDFAYHGTLYPIFEQGEETLARTQIVELGTDITHPDYRGQGLGQHGLLTRLSMLQRWQRPGVDVLGLATVKRLVTGYVYGKMNVHPVHFSDTPYLSFLTDSCEGSSERFGHESCQYRRQPGENNRDSLRQLFQQIGANAYIPCTLVTTDARAAANFDQRMRTLHAQWLGESVPVGSISREAYASIENFYTVLASRAQQR